MEAAPTPIVLVGENVTGKSIILSIVADGLIEIAKKHYTNVTSTIGLANAYFRSSGSGNSKLGENFNYCLIKFSDAESGEIFYSDVAGNIPTALLETGTEIFQRFSGNLTSKEKSVSGSKDLNSAVEQVFSNNVLCYFPPSRHEKPFWLTDYEYKDLDFYSLSKHEKRLDYEIILESTWKINRAWISSVYLDSLSDVYIGPSGNPEFRLNEAIRFTDLRKNRDNVEKIISAILRESGIQIYATLRNNSEARKIALIKNNAMYLPSIDFLSTGQALLLNMFCSILRLAETDDLSKSRDLDQISGIVVIDEIDAHLHSELQYEILPELIALFPRVQFFISTHSPLFVLGLEKRLGSGNMRIYDMKVGGEITSERFSEYQKSYNYYKESVIYEEDIKSKLKDISRPIVFVEGETDVIYILKAIEVFGRNDVLQSLSIDKVGMTINGQEKNGGDSGLDKLKDFIATNPNFLTRKTMLMYDCDIRKQDETIGLLSIRGLPNINKLRNNKGIENLLPEKYFIFTNEEYNLHFDIERSTLWTVKEESKDYGVANKIENFQKVKFAEWFCNTQANVDTMKDFKIVIEMLDDFINF